MSYVSLANRISPEAQSQRTEIERALGYITDLGTVAAYYNVSRTDVAIIRRHMIKEPASKRLKGQGWDAVGCVSDAAVNMSEIGRRNDAEAGCEALKERLDAYFRRWEIDNGFRPSAGVLLVPGGWQPKQSVAA